jgi:hypothetical protein
MSDIEDDTTSQRVNRDDVEESDEEPSRSRVKKGKGKRRVQQEANDDSDSDEAINVENFPDQPLNHGQMNTLLGLAQDWQRLAEVISRPFEKYGLTAGALADLDDDDAKTVRIWLLYFRFCGYPIHLPRRKWRRLTATCEKAWIS